VSSETTFEVKCPGCNLILIIDRVTGKVLEQRKPLVEAGESTGDRFEDAFLRVKKSGERVETKVAQAKEREKSKMDRLNKLFDESLKKKIEEGDTGKPASPYDLE